MNFHDYSWIWHPEWNDQPNESSAGGFVHFRKRVDVNDLPRDPVLVAVTADTRYKLYINSQFLHYGPVKGDGQLWFYDELDIQPYLKLGTNHIAIHVLRLNHGTRFGTSFPRMPLGGLRVKQVQGLKGPQDDIGIDTDDTWEAAIDVSAHLAIHPDEMFLHIYERVEKEKERELHWVPAKPHKIFTAFGLTPPWHLAPRQIPLPRLQPAQFRAIHNLRSTVSQDIWEAVLLAGDGDVPPEIILPPGTVHHIELEASQHLTAFLSFRFKGPTLLNSELRIAYSESYEDLPPEKWPYRLKSDHRDTSKMLIGPYDHFTFGGEEAGRVNQTLGYHAVGDQIGVYAPFHFRTFRFLALDIKVTEETELVFLGLDILRTNYPLEVIAEFNVESEEKTFPAQQLWDTSILTLENCMHDCYEDCPFYEQLQYAMDVRSSALFIYCVSGDDRLARQAILQLHNSFQPAIGLTASRTPCEHLQIIPHFSLFWICMVVDHFEHFGDAEFTSQFLPICDAVLESFRRRIDPTFGLVRCYESDDFWDFVDWTEEWKPFGVPPAGKRTGFQTFSSSLYAYTLQQLVSVLGSVNRSGLAAEYLSRSDALIRSIRTHCFDGKFFTDGLAIKSESKNDYSQHNQVWAILCGAVAGQEAASLLDEAL